MPGQFWARRAQHRATAISISLEWNLNQAHTVTSFSNETEGLPK